MTQINKTNIKESFRHVKEHMTEIEIRLLSLEEAVKRQNEVIDSIVEKLAKTSFLTEDFPGSIGNNGVNQSINQSINHSTTNQAPINQALKHLKEDEIRGPETAKEEIKRIMPFLDLEGDIMTPKPAITPGKKLENESFKDYMNRMDKLFFNIPKQELLVFLAIYQLEDDSVKDIGYTEISKAVKLSENCIRSYISFLRKAGIPLKIIKFNNQRTIFSIDKEFRTLNLKQKLIDLYYSKDPRQKSLFESL